MKSKKKIIIHSGRENFIIRHSNKEDDMKLLEPFLDESAQLLEWIARQMVRLRKNATKEELLVATYLLENRVYYTAQAPFRLFLEGHGYRCYFADFYIPALKVIIEIDGGQHSQPENLLYDMQRDNAFKKNGIATIRITNRAVLNGQYKRLIPIPDEKFLRPKKIIYLKEGVSALTRAQKIEMLNRILSK